ncbi:MAG: COG1470 family protein, partial [Candidatus Thorarchaeota archaeon]
VVSANYSYECPFVDLNGLMMARNNLETSMNQYDEMAGNLEYLIRESPEQKSKYQSCYDTALYIKQRIQNFLVYLDDVIANPALSNTTEARNRMTRMVDENARMINSNCYGLVGLLKIVSITPPKRTEVGKTAHASLVVENTAPTDYYSYVECTFTDPNDNSIVKKSNCVKISSGQAHEFSYDIDVNVTGEWSMVCSVYGSLQSDCSTSLHDVSDVKKFNVYSRDIYVSDVYGTCSTRYVECYVTPSKLANCVGCRLDGTNCRKIGVVNSSILFRCDNPGVGEHELQGFVFSSYECKPIEPTVKTATVSCGGCGDDIIQSDETCEPPNSDNNEHCLQSTWTCKGKKYGVRDEYGACGQCECIYDPFEYSCVKGLCDATCGVDEDCDDNNPNTIDYCSDDCSCVSTTSCPFSCESECEDDLVAPNCYIVKSHGAIGCGNKVCCEKIPVECPNIQMTITKPLTDEVIGSLQLIEASVNPADRVEYSFDKLSSSCTQSNWSSMTYNVQTRKYEATWDTTTVSDGSYYICVKAYYKNETRTVSNHVVVNNYDIDLISQGNGQVKAGYSIEYQVTMKNVGSLPDAYKVTTSITSGWAAQLKINNQEINEIELTPGASAVLQLNVTSPADANVGDVGVLNLYVEGHNSSEVETATITTTVSELNNLPPVINNIEADSQVYIGQPISVSADITDPENDDITAKICKSHSCNEFYCNMTNIGDTYSCKFPINEEGSYEYYIYARDSRGAVSLFNNSVQVITEPEEERYINILKPKSNSKIKSTILVESIVGGSVRTVEYSYSELSSACLDGSWYSMNYNEIKGIYEAPIDTTTLKDGVGYYFCVRATYYDDKTEIASVKNVIINNHDFTIDGAGSASVKAGESLLYQMFLRNTGSFDDTYSVDVNIIPSTWSISFKLNGELTNSITLGSDDVAEILLNITAPSDSNIGDTATVTVKVSDEKTKTAELSLRVSDVSNRAPEIRNISYIPTLVKKADTITFFATIRDPDGDNILAKVCN